MRGTSTIAAPQAVADVMTFNLAIAAGLVLIGIAAGERVSLPCLSSSSSARSRRASSPERSPCSSG